MSTSSPPRANTFGASGLAPGTSVLGFEVLISPTVPNSFSFNGPTGGPGLLSLVLGPFKGPARRLKSVDCLSSGSPVRKTNTSFFPMHRHASLERL